MKIGFDAKRAMQNYTGLGNYSRFVINSLYAAYREHEYYMFCPKVGNEAIMKNFAVDNSMRIISNENKKMLWRTLGIVKDIKQANIDIYHGLSNELPYHIDKSGAKSVVTMHDLIFLKHPQFYPILERNIYNIKAKYACQVADRIIAVSECTKRDIVECYKINPAKISVIYQGCSPSFSEKANDEQKAEVLAKYNLPSRFILSIGSIEDRKNILLVVKALKELPDVHFVAIGRKRKYTEKVIAYAQQHGLADRLHIVNSMPQDDLPVVLQAADIFIYPSLYEGFGIPIIEAMYAKIPVIAATGSCLEEAGGPDSIYVNPHDEHELAREIKRVLADDVLRKHMTSKGLEYVKQFTEERSARETMQLYNEL